MAGTLAGVFVLAATYAGAQTPGRSDVAAGPAGLVLLRSPRCDPGSFDADAFVQLLAIELLTARLQLVRDDLAAPSAEMILEVPPRACDPRTRELSIGIWESATGKRHEHAVTLYDIEPRARPRALALALAELIQQRKREPHLQGAPLTSPPTERFGPTVEPPSERRRFDSAVPNAYPSEQAKAEPPRGPEAQLAAQGRLFAAESTLFFGANLAGSFPLSVRWLRGRVDLGGGVTSLEDPLGQVHLGLFSGGLSLLASTGVFPALFIGPHLELGYAYAAGIPIAFRSQGSIDGRFVAMASLLTGARFQFGSWAAAFELDFGASVSGVEVFADNRRIAATQGIFGGARAGVVYTY